ncbi:MAG: DNA translocase FtsK [Erysipelotrichaceae bacterium]|nr:DNA translocase FtsK [Erysipelotrichaceae bacterium]
MAAKKTTRSNSRSKSAQQRRQAAQKKAQEAELRRYILIVLISAVTLVAYMRMGVVGVVLNNAQRFLFGRFYFIVMGVILIQIAVLIINGRNGITNSRNPWAVVLILAAFMLICSMVDTPQELRGWDIWKSYTEDLRQYFTAAPENTGGGVIGALLLSLTTMLLGRAGTVVVIIVLFIIAALLLVSLETYKQAFGTIREYFTRPLEDDDDDDEDYEEPAETSSEPEQKQPNIFMRFINWFFMEDADDDDEEEVEEEPAPKQYLIPEKTKPEPEPVRQLGFRIDDCEPSTEDMVPIKSKPIEETKSIFLSIDDLVDRNDRPQVPRQEITLDEEPVIAPPPVFVPEPEPEPIVPQPAVQHPAPAPAAQPPVQQTPARRSNKPYQLPKMNLLDPIPVKPKDDPNVEAAQEKGELLIQVLRNFDIEARLLETHIGPAVTKFEIRPESNVKVSKILNLTDDVKMQLAVRDIRIEAPIPGHNAVGVEVPNVQPIPVKMKELIQMIPEKDKNQPLLFILGKDLLGNCVTCRLDKMPHLLIAGATGSGKSVCMNSIITSLLMRTKPDEVKMLLIDPKKVEFTPYHKIPHLIGPVINDPSKANNALKVIVRIMEERYDIFSKCGVRNIQVYNEKVKDGSINNGNTPAQPDYQFMPYIVVIIDELADLMAVAGKEVEGSIQRITQLARAAGIHLIVATQRPSTDVITGIIKANIPSRIAFSVSSGIDSRTILDHVGAERLLGNGDMLYMPIGQSAATRVQGVFVTDDEVHRITDFVSSQTVPMYDDAFVLLEGVEGGEDIAVVGADADPLYEEIKAYVIDAQKASTSLLQRRFGIGYNRAARMIDLLEQKGVIGPAQGSKPREVFIKKDSSQE